MRIITYKCDVCGTEFKEEELGNLHYQAEEFEVTVNYTTGPVTDVCKYCILDAVSKLDDRPKKVDDRPDISVYPVVNKGRCECPICHSQISQDRNCCPHCGVGLVWLTGYAELAGLIHECRVKFFDYAHKGCIKMPSNLVKRIDAALGLSQCEKFLE